MKKQKRAAAIWVACSVVGMGCHLQRDPESSDSNRTWRVQYLDGTVPEWGEVEVWTPGGPTSEGWALGASTYLGNFTLANGMGEWPLELSDELLVNVTAQHPNGSLQERKAVLVTGPGPHVVELPTPTGLTIRCERITLDGGRLHARLADTSDPPSLATWLVAPPTSDGTPIAADAAPAPVELAFEFPVGPATWTAFVQWYWQPEWGGIVPLSTDSFAVLRSQAGSTAPFTTYL